MSDLGPIWGQCWVRFGFGLGPDFASGLGLVQVLGLRLHVSSLLDNHLEETQMPVCTIALRSRPHFARIMAQGPRP